MMKVCLALLKKQISEKDGTGSVVLRTEEPEDMWHTYNLIHVSDSVKTTTIRKMRAYHTLDLETNRDSTLTKKCWDVMSLERINTACDITKQAELVAVVMQVGLAHLCFIKGDMTVIRAKIETSVPKKRPGSSARAKGAEKFYANIVRSIRQHIDFKLVKCVLLASPGFVKDDLFKLMIEQAVRQDDKLILENKPKFVLCHSSSGHKHALDEVLNDPALQSQERDTKAVEDVKCLDRFFNMLRIDQDRACYGYKHVVRANANMAIETLLVTDLLFRSQDVATRRKYVDLVESVRENGGTVRLFSSLHLSGEKLAK
uniref:Eukaryotic peptide chain release factor subunit 1 n=1 Tax=Hyaloperonospora arabidopsidis (strain Emoy2) TaxID=559515 RepID=M4B9A5_HYAAE